MPMGSTSVTVSAIDDFIASQANLAFWDDFDKAMRGREERLPNRHSGEPAPDLAWLLYELARAHSG